MIDPRRTETAEDADLHLPIRPGSDVALLNGLLAHMPRERAGRPRPISTRTSSVPDGFWDALDEGDRPVVDRRRLRRRRRPTSRASTTCSPPTRARSPCSARASTSRCAGTDKVNAIINVHLATGRIGKPGAGAVLDHRPAQRDGRARGRRAGLHARRAYGFRARERRARRALLGRAAHGDQAGPEGGRHVRGGRATGGSRRCGSWRPTRRSACPTPAWCARRWPPARSSSSPTASPKPTPARYAHVRLPAAGWGEKDGTVTNSERRISRQRACSCRAGRGAARLVDRRARSAGAWAGRPPSPMTARPTSFASMRRLSAYQNDGDAAVRPSPRTPRSAMPTMTRWRRSAGAATAFRRRPLSDAGRQGAAGRRCAQAPLAEPLARLAADAQHRALSRPVAHDDAHRPRRPSSRGTARSRWSRSIPTMPRRLAIADGGLARVATRRATACSASRVSDGQRPRRVVHADPLDRSPVDRRPHRPAAAPAGRSAFGPAGLQADAGADREGRDRMARLPARRATSRTPLPDCLWRDARHACRAALLYELAGDGDPDACSTALPAQGRADRGARRGARLVARSRCSTTGRLAAALFVTRDRRAAAARLADRPARGAAQAAPTLLAGRAPGARSIAGRSSASASMSACSTIVRAIAEQRLTDVAAVGKALGAGTNCGSCRPAIAST